MAILTDCDHRLNIRSSKFVNMFSYIRFKMLWTLSDMNTITNAGEVMTMSFSATDRKFHYELPRHSDY